MSDNTKTFTKDNLDHYLKELAKEYKKLAGKHMPAEIILIGGASILTNYGFRDMTTDIDAIIIASSAMKDAINIVYLIAMKLRSARKYKNDLSDIVGILAEHHKRNDIIHFSQIDLAVKDLYGSWDDFTEDARNFITDTFKHGNFEAILNNVIQEEKQSREILIDFEEDYPNVVNQANINDILTQLKKKHSEQ